MTKFSCSAAGRINLLALLLLLALLVSRPGAARAQVNSWTNPGSGAWEQLSWSLGVRPGAGQSVMLTNAGWKAVMIGAGTAQNYPQTLSVGSVTISSPANSFNTLLLNYAGTQNPLRVNGLTIASNSSVVMLASALVVNDPFSSTFSIGGTFNQGSYSTVTATNLDIGYNGPGVYNLTNGFLTTRVEYLGGGFPAVLNQEGGIHSASILQLNSGATFYLRGGWFTGDIDLSGGTVYQQSGTNSSAALDVNSGQYFVSGGMVTGSVTIARSGPATFTQDGGFVNAPLDVGAGSFGGTYILNGGVHSGPISAGTGYGPQESSGSLVQNGGTNFGSLSLGGGVDYHFGHRGSYTLSNGVLVASGIALNSYGTFTQWGGSTVAGGSISLSGAEFFPGGNFGYGTLSLHGGTLSATSLSLHIGSFSQSGGDCRIAGDLTLVGAPENWANLSGGTLCDSNVIVQYRYAGGFAQNGGTHIITNLLSLDAAATYYYSGYNLNGGELIVSNITVNNDAIFRQTGGTLTQSGVLTLIGGQCYAGPGYQRFGQLQLGFAWNTNSLFHMPPGPCVLQFSDSHTLTWSNQATLTIENWMGSLYGGGGQQLVFGSNGAALTGQQLSQIRFRNPAGLPSGTYPARILATGEIVPNPGAALPPVLSMLGPEPDGAMQLALQGEAGRTYVIEVSTNLVNWTAWTTQYNSSGTIPVMDSVAKNYPRRFYRGVMLP